MGRFFKSVVGAGSGRGYLELFSKVFFRGVVFSSSDLFCVFFVFIRWFGRGRLFKLCVRFCVGRRIFRCWGLVWRFSKFLFVVA